MNRSQPDPKVIFLPLLCNSGRLLSPSLNLIRHGRSKQKGELAAPSSLTSRGPSVHLFVRVIPSSFSLSCPAPGSDFVPSPGKWTDPQDSRSCPFYLVASYDFFPPSQVERLAGHSHLQHLGWQDSLPGRLRGADQDPRMVARNT